MDTHSRLPDENEQPFKGTFVRKCDHEYVDFYTGWCYVDKERTTLLQWVFCKKCLDRKKIYIDLSESLNAEEEE